MNLKFHYLWRKLKSFVPWIQVPVSRFFMFRTKITADQFERALIEAGYQYNYFSYDEQGQISNLRKLKIFNGTIMQVHVRLFDDGAVTAHYEVSYEEDAMKHLDGSTVVYPDKADIKELEAVITACALDIKIYKYPLQKAG